MNNIAIGIILALAFISLVVVFCVLLIKLYVQKIKEHNQKQLDFQESIKKTIIETQEQVLNNVSKDLHDDSGQQLTGINFQLEHLKLDYPELKNNLEPISESLGKLSQSIRDISHSLNNQMILQGDFIKAFESEVNRLKKNKKMTIGFTFEELVPKVFSDNERIVIYRIFQECINNCLKHSKCNTMSITISTKPEFEMVFHDNGVGFDSQQQSGRPSMGFVNMKTRANDINYSLAIHSKPGEGTHITLSETKTELK